MTGHRGLTLIEALVAMLLVLVVIAGALAFVARGRAAQRAGESLARIEEALDAAFALIADEARLAGYLGLAPPGTAVTGATPLGAPELPGLEVSGGCLPGLAQDLGNAVAATDARYAYASPPATGCRAGPRGRHQPASDTLVLRHAAAESALPATGRLQLETTARGARLVADGIGTLGADARWHDLEVGAFYVSADSTGRNGYPSLRRKRLVGGTRPAFQDEELVSGISDLQVEYGVDEDGDGAVDRWERPEATPAVRLPRALRLTLESRSDVPEPHAAPDGRRRRATRVITLRNAGPG